MKKIISLKMATMTTLPLSVTLISSIGKDGNPNIAVVTYVTGINEEPPMFGIALRPGKHTNKLIRESKEFVINIPTTKLVREVDFCGTHSGRNVRKFDQLGLTPLKAKKVKPPLIAQCPINIECKLKQIVKLPSHDLFIGEAVAVHVDEKQINPSFIFTTFLDYRIIGKKIGTAYQEHKKLNLAGISDKGAEICR